MNPITVQYDLVGGGTLAVSSWQDGPYLEPRRLEIHLTGGTPAIATRVALLPRRWRANDYSPVALDRLVRTRLMDAETTTLRLGQGVASTATPDSLHWQQRDGFDPSRWNKE